ncbi:MAG: hypothetical protein ACU0CO_08660 [Shimia sp.]
MTVERTAARLADLYDTAFGGKPSGRYRIPEKLLRDMMGRRRLWPEDVTQLTRALAEHGCVLIDMDGFFVVMSANSFVNYRRVGKDQARL